MRRYISLACVALIVVMCMVSPVSAAETQSVGYFNLMEYGYCYIDGLYSSNFRVDISNNSKSFVFPHTLFGTKLGKFEFLIWTNISDLSISHANGACTIVPSNLGGFFYVVTGNLFAAQPDFTISSSGSGTLYFVSCKAMPYGYSIVDIPFDFQVYDAADGELLEDQKNIVRFEYEDSPYFTDVENMYERQIRIYPNKSQLAGFDYFDLDIYIQNLEIDSISASFGGNALDVSYITSFVGDGIYNDSVSTGDVGQDKTYGIYKVVLRVDVSGISLVDGLPTVFITYNANNYYGFQPYVYVYGINAGVNFNSSDSFTTSLNYNFNKLNGWLSSHTSSILSLLNSFKLDVNSSFGMIKSELNIHFTNVISKLSVLLSDLEGYFNSLFSELRIHSNNVVVAINQTKFDMNTKFNLLSQWISAQTSTLENAIRGDTAPGDSFQDEVDQKDQQLNDMAAVMDSVERPDLGSVNVSADSYVDQTVLAASMSGITSVIGGPVFLDVIIMSLIMATAGYVLFGKR